MREFPRWRVYRWVDRDDDSIIGTAYYFGWRVEDFDMPYMDDMGMEGWCDLGADLLYRVQRHLLSLAEWLTSPLAWLAYRLGEVAGWFHVRKPPA